MNYSNWWALLACERCSTLRSKIRFPHVKCIAASTGRFNYNCPLPRFIFWKVMGRSKLLKVWKDGEFPLWNLENFLSLLICVCNLRPFVCCQESHWVQRQVSRVKVQMQIPSTDSFGDFEVKMGCSAVMLSFRWITFHIGFETEEWEPLSLIRHLGNSGVLVVICLNVSVFWQRFVGGVWDLPSVHSPELQVLDTGGNSWLEQARWSARMF